MKDALSNYFNHRGWRHLPALVLIALFWIVIAYYGGQEVLANAQTTRRLVVYGFSTQEDVLTQAIIPAFEQKWKDEHGQQLSIEGVFGPSGTIAGQINLGASADVAIFSNARHVMWLKLGRRVRMETQPVVIGTTPIVIVTRPGNPAKISGFSDLVQPDVTLIHANPHSSGAGEWAVLAEYGSVLLETGSRAAAEQQLKAIWRNVRLLAPSARAAMMLFELGAGDAFVTYEQDAELSLARGIPLEIILPPRTILAEHVAVTIDDNLTINERTLADAFIRFLESDQGQLIYRNYYQRSISSDREELPVWFHPFTVQDLGGWDHAYDVLILSLWQEEIEPSLDLLKSPDLLGQGGTE